MWIANKSPVLRFNSRHVSQGCAACLTATLRIEDIKQQLITVMHADKCSSATQVTA